MIRAKFICESKTATESGISVKLAPVTGGSIENESFFKWTPFGSLEMGLLSPDTAAFEPGKSYYVDLSPAE